MKVDIYSDVICPWCYIGHRRLKRALAALANAAQVEVVFRPYQLDPQAPDTAVPLAQYLERRFGRRVDGLLDRVTEEAQREGIAIAWDRVLSVNTRTAHRLLTWADRESGSAVQGALAERLFDLHFAQGGNIGDVEQLADAAAAEGLDYGRARAFLESDEGADALETAFEAARRFGIRAVPTFVIDSRYLLQGAQSAATFVETLKQAAAIGPPLVG